MMVWSNYKYVGSLDASYVPAPANDNLSNKQYIFGGSLSNLVDLLKAVDTRSIILGIFDPVLY